MNRNKVVLALLLALLASPPLDAQSTPTLPLVKIPDHAAWTVDITQRIPDGGAPSATTPPAPHNASKARARDPNAYAVKVEVIQTGDIARYHTTWSDGTNSEEWLTAKFLFFQDHESGQTGILERAADPRKNYRYPQYDESLFSWLKLNVFAGQKDYAGKNCFYYKWMTTVRHVEVGDQEEDIPSSPVPYQAWIETKTNLPVAFDDGQLGILYVYTFQPPPKDRLVLPPKYQAMLDRYENFFTPPKTLADPRPPL